MLKNHLWPQHELIAVVYTVTYVAAMIVLNAQWQPEWRTGQLFLSTGYLLHSTRAEANIALKEFPALAARVEGDSVVCMTGDSHTWVNVKFDSDDRIAAYRFCLSKNHDWIRTREQAMLDAMEDAKSQELLDISALRVSLTDKQFDQTMNQAEYLVSDQVRKGWIFTAVALGALFDATHR